MDTSRSSDSIDLSVAFVRLIKVLRNNLLTIIIVVALSLALGVGYYWLVPRTYESKMIIQSDILSESYALKMAENLETHIKDKDYDFLSSKLNLTVDEASHLKEFKTVSALTPMSQQMPEKEKIVVVISVRIQDNAILPKIQAGIIDYFSNNQYVKKRVEEKRKKFEGLIASIEYQIKMIDTLKTKIIDGKFAGAKIGGVAIMDVAGLYGVTANLYEKKYDFMLELATVESVQVIEDFTPYGKPVWPKLSIVLPSSLMFAALVLFALISYSSLKGQINQ